MQITGASISEPREMMDRGKFLHFQTWAAGSHDCLCEYWRGMEGNGAIICDVSRGNRETLTHYKTPGEAIAALQRRGLKVPGVYA